MRAVVYNRFGNPRDVLTTEERPMPEPGPGQVRLALIQSPVHNHDLSTVRGNYGIKPPLPAIGGTEALATVNRLGPDVTHLSVGQRVCVMTQGVWAECFLAKAASAVPVPASLSEEAACQLLAMPLSAYLLLDDLEVKAGDWIIQNAANGAVGRLIDTLARQREINVVNLVRHQKSADALAAEGVKHVLATEEGPGNGWTAQVAGLTGGAPVLRAVDSVGGKSASELLELLAPGGTLISFGAMGGQPLAIDPGQLIFKGKTVKGFWATARTERSSTADRVRMIGDVIQKVASGALPLRVAATFDLARVGEAVAASDSAGRGGKIALRPA